MMTSEMVDTFRVPFRLDGVVRFLIWRQTEDEATRVVLDGTGRMPVFASVDALDDYAERIGLSLSGHPGDVDYLDEQFEMDVVVAWLDAPTPDTIACVLFLNIWNLVDDIALATGTLAESGLDANLDLYDKLFWGSNLPSMTPAGESYTPTWDTDEVARLADMLGRGLRLFRRVAILHE